MLWGASKHTQLESALGDHGARRLSSGSRMKETEEACRASTDGTNKYLYPSGTDRSRPVATALHSTHIHEIDTVHTQAIIYSCSSLEEPTLDYAIKTQYAHLLHYTTG